MIHDSARYMMRELAALIPADRIRLPATHEARVASLILEPSDSAQIAAIASKCETDGIALAPLGAARSLAVIRSQPVPLGISLARMARVIAYEPDDMTVAAEPGITIAELNAILAQCGQRLPVDPAAPQHTTVGSLIAAAHAGPLRHSEGTVRDLLIGIGFAGHGGRLIHGGGRVVKNVAGYDLMKVMTGSFGTLGIITEATFKLRPIPRRYTLITARFDNATGAFTAAQHMNNELPLLHLEVTSNGVSHLLGLGAGFTLFAGFGGSAAEVEDLRLRSTAILGARGEIHDEQESDTIYQQLRDFEWPRAAISAQIAVPPSALHDILEQIDTEFRAHAGVGVAQLYASSPIEDGGARNSFPQRQTVDKWRRIAREHGGNLRVVRLSPRVPELALFDEPDPVSFRLMQRLKATFDPAGIFNPNCFVGGI
jgi:glycolate oxidase FAD binding subunit